MAADEIWSDPIPTVALGLEIVPDVNQLIAFDHVTALDLLGGSAGGGNGPCEDDRPDTGMLYPRG